MTSLFENKIFRNSALIGGSFIAISGVAYYLYKQIKASSSASNEKIISKKVIIDTLTELKNQLFPLYFTIADLQKNLITKEIESQNQMIQERLVAKQQGDFDKVYQIEQKFQEKGIEVTEEINQDQIIQALFDLLQREMLPILQLKEELIYKKNDITQNEMNTAIGYYHNDQEITALKQIMYEYLYNAFQGVEPPLNFSEEILNVLTPEKLLIAVKKIVCNAGNRLCPLFEHIKTCGEFQAIDIQDEKIIKHIAQLKLNQDKEKILIEEGFGQFSHIDQPISLYVKLTQKYKRENEWFKINEAFFDKKHDKLMELFTNIDVSVTPEFVKQIYETEEDIDVFLSKHYGHQEEHEEQLDQDEEESGDEQLPLIQQEQAE